MNARWICVGMVLIWAGCSDEVGAVDADAGPEVLSEDTPTWHRDVAPLVGAKCSQCHEEGGIAPFDLTKYESAKQWAGLMASAVEAGTMPPFLAQDTDECTPRMGWQDDLRMSDDQKLTLRAWADAGAPEGDADSAAEVVRPTPVTLEREDIVMKVPEKVIVDGTKDLHSCMIVDPNIEEDTYVVSRLITSGNTAVLHHVVSYVINPGWHEDETPRTKAELEQELIKAKGVGIGGRYDCFGGPGLGDAGIGTEMLDAWAPGGVPNAAPPHSGQPLSKDALVLLDVHYHPTGAGPETDEDTYLALQTTDDRPLFVSRVILMGNFEEDAEYGGGIAKLVKQDGESEAQFMIPAGAEEHVEEMSWEWKLSAGTDLKIYGAGTHMHYVGTDMMVTLDNAKPRGSETDQECLIHTPVWDFNWQRGYAYDGEMDDWPGMETGDTLNLRCKFNNSMSNPAVVEALADQGLDGPVDVPLGEDTLDEMCLVGLGIIYQNPN